jgi:class 3 adenylate cyclase
MSKKKRGFRVSLLFKFSLFTAILILVVMGSVGYTLYAQQRRTLTHEVLERGQTIAEGVISGAREALPINDVLSIAIIIKKAAQPGDVAQISEDYDFKNPSNWITGLSRAMQSLKDELPGQLEQALDRKGIHLGLGLVTGKPQAAQHVVNEGVYEVVLVDSGGIVKGRSTKGETDIPYQAPSYIELPSEDAPFPQYEQEYFVGETRHVRRLFDIAKDVVDPASQTVLGKVHLGLSQGLIQRVVFDATMKLAAVAILSLALGVLFTYLLVTVLVRPIGKLVGGVLAIANGDFDTRVKVTTRDELGELTQAFNTMAKSLGENELLKGAFTRYVSGAALQQLLNDPSKTGLHSRRALATIYSSDVRGFTAMSESLEPEHVVQVINTYLSLQTDIILKYEGVVDKFIGDATIGVYGKEDEREDDAIRAVRTAMEVQESITLLNEGRTRRGEVAKEIGIGINTGVVVTGNMGSTKKMEYTTAGENTIVADKLCDICPAGKVWITQATYDIVRDQVVAEPRDPLLLKGRTEPIPVYEIIKLK